MPKRTDIESVLILGAGPIVIFAEPDARALAGRLRSEGIDHVLFGREQFRRDVVAGPRRGAWTDAELQALDAFFETVAEKVVRDGPLELYRVP